MARENVQAARQHRFAVTERFDQRQPEAFGKRGEHHASASLIKQAKCLVADLARA